VAVWTFLTNFLTINEEKKDLLKIFKTLDTNGDGQLTREELLNGYWKEIMRFLLKFEGYMQTMDKMKAQEYVTQIMETCDTDKSGKIDYNGS